MSDSESQSSLDIAFNEDDNDCDVHGNSQSDAQSSQSAEYLNDDASSGYASSENEAEQSEDEDFNDSQANGSISEPDESDHENDGDKEGFSDDRSYSSDSSRSEYFN